MPAKICQVAMCTCDIPATTRTYSRGLGFASAGGRPLRGERVARIQGLPTGADTTLMIWWLVGAQDFMQLELFTHTTPPQRPRPEGWRPNDLGWVRWGVEVDDFDAVLAALRRGGADVLGAPSAHGDRRRACFRERGAKVLVEVMEADPQAPRRERQRFYNLAPRVRYMTASVVDVPRARDVFVAAGLSEAAPDTLHTDVHEAMWGLAGALRETAVLTDGEVCVELVGYIDPPGAPPEDGRLLSYQGMMNVALGFRDSAEARDVFGRLLDAGCTAAAPVAEIVGGTYLTTPDGLSVELLVAPRELDAGYGFAPMPRFPQPPIWPHHVPAAVGAR